jgi:hypothetical protein
MRIIDYRGHKITVTVLEPGYCVVGIGAGGENYSIRPGPGMSLCRAGAKGLGAAYALNEVDAATLMTDAIDSHILAESIRILGGKLEPLRRGLGRRFNKT